MGDSVSTDLINLLPLFATDNIEINIGKCDPPPFISPSMLII